MKNSVKLGVLCACAWSMLLAQPAHAYLDPATTSLFLQALAAAGVTCLAFMRGLREKIMSFFRGKKKDD